MTMMLGSAGGGGGGPIGLLPALALTLTQATNSVHLLFLLYPVNQYSTLLVSLGCFFGFIWTFLLFVLLLIQIYGI